MKLIKFFLLIAIGVIIMNISCKKQENGITLILKNGIIYTVDGNFSTCEAVAVQNDKIFKTGSNSEIEKLKEENTKIIDLKGATVVPGLYDAHGHLLGQGKFLENIDLKGTTSFEEVVHKVKEKAKSLKEGTWILGRGWDQNDWEIKDFPNHELLSKVVPNHPVWLTRVDGHAGIANKMALELAKIEKNTNNPAGGKILKDKKGYPTGVFVDNAESLITKIIPKLSIEEKMRLYEIAGQDCLKKGLTAIGDAGITPEELKIYKKLYDTKKLPIRVYAMLDLPETEDFDTFFKENKVENYKSMFFVKAVKLYMDGALGSRGAAMIEPYSDDPENTGLVTIEFKKAEKIVKAAIENGIQVCTHAIGDNGNRLTLKLYEEFINKNKEKDLRFRVEHAQIVNLDDIKRFKELNVIPSMQPTHATSDMYWAEDRVGKERIKGAYAWKSFLNEGCYIPCGSDFPIESNDPLLGFYAAITRQDVKGFPENGWYPGQKMTRVEALKGFTIWAAKASFMENFKGTIEKGKVADFTILSKNIMEIPAKEVLDTKVLYTIVNGEVKYKGE